MRKIGLQQISLVWPASCLETDIDYEIYQGTMGDFADRVPVVCSTDGLTNRTFTPRADSAYYIVVPRNQSLLGQCRSCARGLARDDLNRLQARDKGPEALRRALS